MKEQIKRFSQWPEMFSFCEFREKSLRLSRLLPILLMLFVISAAIGNAEGMPVRRVPLNDEISLLDSSTAAEVKRFSQLLYRDHKSELAVLIMRSTRGQDAGAYAERVFNHWGLGQSGVNNGMLILFAIDDRRVEIKPGIRYRDHFNQNFCTSLLTRYVVPEMRAGRPGSGVLAAAREVAAEIRRFEESAGGASSKGQTGSVGQSGSVGQNRVQGQSGSAGFTNQGEQQKNSLSSGSSPVSKTIRQRPGWVDRQRAGVSQMFHTPIRLIIFALIILIVASGGYYFYQAYYLGRLLMPVWMFVLLVLITSVTTVALASTISDFFEGMFDGAFSGGGAVGVASLLWCASHVCPRCNKYMSVSTRTLRSATYSSSGLGEKTVHCENCGYHNVSTYTISRKTRSSSRSSSSGGGRSSGGGGGASW